MSRLLGSRNFSLKKIFNQLCTVGRGTVYAEDTALMPSLGHFFPSHLGRQVVVNQWELTMC